MEFRVQRHRVLGAHCRLVLCLLPREICTVRVLIQIRSNPAVHAASMAFAASADVTADMGSSVPGIELDAGYPPVQVPGSQTLSGGAMMSLSQPLTFSFEPTQSTYLLRGHIPDGPQQQQSMAAALTHPNVVGVFADPTIDSCLTCGADPAVGDYKGVAKKLAVAKLTAANMTGAGVALAIVDTGINLAYLKSVGLTVKLDAARSFVPAGVATTPGKHPVQHGTMCVSTRQSHLEFGLPA